MATDNDEGCCRPLVSIPTGLGRHDSSNKDDEKDDENNNNEESHESANQPQPKQLYRYKPSNALQQQVQFLLEREDLTEEDIRAFCRGESTTTTTTNTPLLSPEQQAYRNRRLELFQRIQQLHEGTAQVDVDGRLVLNTNQQQHEPPLPPLQPQQLNNNNNINNNLFPDLALEEEDHQWLQQQERAAAAIVQRTIRRYQHEGVPLEALELIPVVRPSEGSSLTVRRICFAVIAVVAAFCCIMLQPIVQTHRRHNSDGTAPLVHQLANVKEWTPAYLRDCWLKGGSSKSSACRKGVLHIPSVAALVQKFWHTDDVPTWEPHVTQAGGFNHTWVLPCQKVQGPQPRPSVPQNQNNNNNDRDSDQCTVNHHPTSCFSQCFRGIHDGIMSTKDLTAITVFGATLIYHGADHFDIHYETTGFRQQLPSVLTKLQHLLQHQYNVTTNSIQPVAFRVNAVGPMDGAGVPFYGTVSTTSPVRLFNRTNYLSWIDASQRRNELAQYSLPWPFRIQPVRDVCRLMADQQADARFQILTTVFLTDDYQGGQVLYVDEQPYPTRKVRRGLMIDGSRGRVVVSTGGQENLRCRLPTQVGIRATLQVWWMCVG